MTVKGWLSPLLAVLGMVPGWLLAAGQCDRLIATGSPDAPPYLWRDPADPKHLVGANADLLREAVTQLGLKVEFLYGGRRSQALDEVRSGRMDLLADSPLDATQLESMDFIHPPIAQNEIMVWTRRTQALPFNTLADLHGHPGAISERTRLTTAFATATREWLTLRKAPALTPSFQLLAQHQVEYVLAGRYAGSAVVQNSNMTDEIVAQPLPLDRPGLYVALSFNSACNDPWLRGQLSKKMTELSASGAAEEAIQRNLERWKAELRQSPETPDNQEKRS